MAWMQSYHDICTDKKKQYARQYFKNNETNNAYHVNFTFVNIKYDKADW